MSEIVTDYINTGNVVHKKQKMPTLEVRIRNTKHSDGFKPRETIHVRAATLHELKEEVVERLQPSWEKKGVTLDTDKIVVFRVEKDGVGSTYKIKLIVADPLVPTATVESEESEEKKEENTRGASKFIALEYFVKLPEDLLRTVTLGQIWPATYAHPDHSNQWTNVAPLHCAGLAKSERDLPWYGIKKDGEIKAHGVSLRCLDNNETPAPEDAPEPFEKIGEQESTGTTTMTIEKYNNLVELAGGDRDPCFGILQTSVSHKAKNRRGFVEPKESVISIDDESEKKRRKKRNLASTRTPYFRFAIRKGLDLAPYGVAVVYDNSSQNHVTLVRVGNVADNIDGGDSFRVWREDYSLEPMGVFLPFNAVESGLRAKGDPEDFNYFLREKLFKLSSSEPEEFAYRFGPTVFTCLPKVASLFALHDLKLVAKAEPSPPEGEFDTEECQLMHKGALALHRLDLCRDLGRHVALAIEALGEANYAINNLDQSICDTLLATLDGKPDIEDAVNLFDLNFHDVQDALDNMQDLLSSHFENKATEKPQLIHKMKLDP